MQEKDKYRSFKQIVTTFYNEEIEGLDEDIEIKNKGTIKLEPKILYDKFSGEMKIEIKIGTKKMYKIKDLPAFYTRMLEKTNYIYGEKLQFIHTREMFEEKSKPLLDFILKYAEIIKYSNSNNNYKFVGSSLSNTSIVLSNTGLDELFEILKGEKIEIQKDYHTDAIEFTEKQPNIIFSLKKQDEDNYIITPNIDIFNVTIIKGKEFKYILDNKKLYRCTKEFEKTNLKLLEIFRQNYMTEVPLGKKELTEFFSIIVPKVKKAIKFVNIEEDEIEKYKPKELLVKTFLDFDNNNYLVCDVKFCYGKNEFNPLDESIKHEFPRNVIEETKALNLFRKTGFMLDTKNLRFIQPNDEKIYQFMSDDIEIFMQKFDVLVTDNFKTKQIKQPKISNIGIKVENNLLYIDLNNISIDKKELEEVMEKYSLKKKYHRLKDGSFINLEKNQDIEFLDKLITGMDINYKELEKGEIRLPIYRSLYLNQLLKGIKGTEIKKNEQYKNVVNELDKEKIEEANVPKEMENVLRYYQKTGFKWLKTLDSYQFGGILADDMGLRKNASNFINYC